MNITRQHHLPGLYRTHLGCCKAAPGVSGGCVRRCRLKIDNVRAHVRFLWGVTYNRGAGRACDTVGGRSLANTR